MWDIPEYIDIHEELGLDHNLIFVRKSTQYRCRQCGCLEHLRVADGAIFALSSS